MLRVAGSSMAAIRQRLTVALLATSCVGGVPAWCARAADAPAAVARDSFDYDVPLDAHSPWPKFRRDARQSGRSPLPPRDDGRAPWMFHTGKGVFSSPVIDGDGTIYVGSADRTF